MADALTVGAEPIQIVELRQPRCTRTYGVAPCTASGTGDAKCYNGRFTCQDPENFELGTLSLFFSSGAVAERGVAGASYILPFLRRVSTSPVRINVAGADPNSNGLGNRAVCTIELADAPHTDRIVDPYIDERSWGALGALERGTFWSKWLARNPYRSRIEVVVYEGYSGQALADMVKRTYFVENIDGPGPRGSVTIRGKDLFARLEERKAQAPKASPGELHSGITAVATSFEVAGALEADYAASGTLRIGSELMTYTGRAASAFGITFTGVTRGTDGTTAEAHQAEDAVQQCLRWTNATPNEVLYDLLTYDGLIEDSWLPTADWQAEVEDFLASYRLSRILTEPVAIAQLVSELMINVPWFIWWDERSAKVSVRAIRGVEEDPPRITSEANILPDSFSLRAQPEQRASQVWLYFDIKNPVESPTDPQNYRRLRIAADPASELPEQYGEPSIRKSYLAWIRSGTLAAVTGSKLITRFVETPTECSFALDAKDRDLWVGDTVFISHHMDVDETGARRERLWAIISAEEVQPGHVVEYVAVDTTLLGRIFRILAPGAGDYPNDGTGGAYISDANGLLPDGTEGAKVA